MYVLPLSAHQQPGRSYSTAATFIKLSDNEVVIVCILNLKGRLEAPLLAGMTFTVKENGGGNQVTALLVTLWNATQG
jgi:hypothetical protein